MASEKEYNINRPSTQAPRTPPAKEQETQRKEYYIRRVFREDVRQIKALLLTDITQFTQGKDIVKEILWSFHHPNYGSYFHSISYFLTSLGFKENPKENALNLTVFRKKLPKDEHSIHVKVIEHAKAFNIHAHMDKQVHVDHEHNKFTSFLLNKLRSYLENIYKAAFTSREMNIIPKKLSVVPKRSSPKPKVQEPSKRQDKINTLFMKFKSRFRQHIPEIKSKSLSESLERNNLISNKRMREIAYQTITSSWSLNEIQKIRHSRHNIDTFLKREIDTLYPRLRKNYLMREHNNTPLPKKHNKKTSGKVSLIPATASSFPKKIKPPPQKDVIRTKEEHVPSVPKLVYRIDPKELEALEEWGYYEDEEEEFRRHIDSPVTEDIMIQEILPVGKIISIPQEDSGKKEGNVEIIPQPPKDEIDNILERFIKIEFTRFRKKARRDLEISVSWYEIRERFCADFDILLTHYDRTVVQALKSRFKKYLKEDFNADLNMLKQRVESGYKRIRKIKSIISPIRKVSLIILWILCTIAMYLLLNFILHIQWIPYEDLMRFFPIECSLFQCCTVFYGADLYIGLIVFLRLIRRREPVKSEEELGGIYLLGLISFICVICNLIFLGIL
jgi:hypothetical protein